MNAMKTKTVFWAALILFFAASGEKLVEEVVLQAAGNSPLIINEFLASNKSGLVDEDGEFSDWIEIYNRSDVPVNLAGWSLTDDPANPDKWSFPDKTLHSGEYLVVFASGKNRKSTAPGTELHTNFRLSQQSNFVALHNVLDSRFMDVVTPQSARQVRDVAFGRNQQTMEYGFLTNPSPGAPNIDPFVPQEIGLTMQYTIHNNEPDSAQQDALAQALVASGAPPATHDQLGITEIMYNPNGGDDYEFIELKNTSNQTINLAGASFEGVNFSFPLNTPLIAPGQLLVLVRNEAAFARRYPGVEIAGVYTGQLSNEGETITLRGFDGSMLAQVAYDDDRGWPLTPDGRGDSLILVAADGSPDNPLNWRASLQLNGTPGTQPDNSVGATLYQTASVMPGLQILNFLFANQ